MVGTVDELAAGPLFRFADWPGQQVPRRAAGVYTVWRDDVLLYTGMSGRRAQREDDLLHPVPRLGPVSHEPYAEPGRGPSVIREPHVHAACRGQLPLPRGRNRASADTGLQALLYGAVRAHIKVIGTDASAVAARDADKVPVWLSRR
jgi:hypothetical protein